jgi:C2H2 type zinc finger protein
MSNCNHDCGICGQQYGSASELVKHKSNYHTPNLICNGKTYERNEVTGHFECPASDCGLSFNNRQDMQNHLRRHKNLQNDPKSNSQARRASPYPQAGHRRKQTHDSCSSRNDSVTEDVVCPGIPSPVQGFDSDGDITMISGGSGLDRKINFVSMLQN